MSTPTTRKEATRLGLLLSTRDERQYTQMESRARLLSTKTFPRCPPKIDDYNCLQHSSSFSRLHFFPSPVRCRRFLSRRPSSSDWPLLLPICNRSMDVVCQSSCWAALISSSFLLSLSLSPPPSLYFFFIDGGEGFAVIFFFLLPKTSSSRRAEEEVETHKRGGRPARVFPPGCRIDFIRTQLVRVVFWSLLDEPRL